MFFPSSLIQRFLPLLLLALPVCAAAKARRDTITTKQGVEVFIKNDRSRKINLIVEAHVLDAEASLADYGRIGTGMNADYIFRRFVSINAGYKGTYFSYLNMLSRKKNLSENIPMGFSVGGGGIRIHLMDSKGWEHRKMVLESFRELDEKGMPRTTVRTLKAKFPCRRIFGLRGGVYYSTAPMTANHKAELMDPMGKGTVQTTDGSKFTGDYYTNSTTTGFYAGLTRLTHMKFLSSNTINWMEGGSKQTAIFKEVYADVIFANTVIDPFIVKGTEHALEPNGNGGFAISNIGWRVGGRLIATRKRVNLGTSYEIGMRPGLADRGAYVSIGINVAYVK